MTPRSSSSSIAAIDANTMFFNIDVICTGCQFSQDASDRYQKYSDRLHSCSGTNCFTVRGSHRQQMNSQRCALITNGAQSVTALRHLVKMIATSASNCNRQPAEVAPQRRIKICFAKSLRSASTGAVRQYRRTTSEYLPQMAVAGIRLTLWHDLFWFDLCGGMNLSPVHGCTDTGIRSDAVRNRGNSWVRRNQTEIVEVFGLLPPPPAYIIDVRRRVAPETMHNGATAKSGPSVRLTGTMIGLALYWRGSSPLRNSS